MRRNDEFIRIMEMSKLDKMNTKILNAKNADDLSIAINHLRENELVAVPTETVYGLAGNAFSSEAVSKIFAAKERPSFDPLIVHIAHDWILNSGLEGLVERGIIGSEVLSKEILDFFNSFVIPKWPGPFTIILPKGELIPDLVTSGQNTVAIRVPNHSVTQQILSSTDLPLAAPSANRFGRISPTTADAVMSELSGRIAYVCDGGPCDVGVESTIVKLILGNHSEQGLKNFSIQYLRPGFYGFDDLKKELSALGVQIEHIKKAKHQEEMQPGLLEEGHYAPTRPMVWMTHDELLAALLSGKKVSAISWTEDQHTKTDQILNHKNLLHCTVLTPKNNTTEAAARLFQCMRTCDETGAELIVLLNPTLWQKAFQSDSLGAAIQDRLSRAIRGSLTGK